MGKYAAEKWTRGQSDWEVEFNAVMDLLDADFANLTGVGSTSQTSLLVGTGSKAFTIDQASASFTSGAVYRAASVGAPTAIMEGTCASFTGGVLTLTVTVTGGSGTHADWSITAPLGVAAAQPSVDVASATTTNIYAAGSVNARITGTTTITAFDVAPAGSPEIEVRFAGILTLTHNATSLILPGGVNITTAAGDLATFLSEGSGNWRCTKYVRAATGFVGSLVAGTSANNLVQLDGSAKLPAVDGSALTGLPLGLKLLATGTGPASTIDFTSGIDSTYDEYLFEMIGVRPVTDNVNLQLLVQTGGTFQTGTSYYYSGRRQNAAAPSDVSSTAATFIPIVDVGVGNGTAEGVSGAARLYNPGGTLNFKTVESDAAALHKSSTVFTHDFMAGVWTGDTLAVTGVRFQMSSGTIADGSIHLYGVKKS